MLHDRLGRRIDYLRLSVTDHCNLRCQYCMPLRSERAPPPSTLSFDEIVRLVRVFAELGIQRVRLTGGEPLIRKGIPTLVKRLKEIRGIREVLLTTNGVLLKPLARELYEAGLREINIHLDTLSPKRFREVTRWGSLQSVLEGIQAARRAGLFPIKLNAVLQRGVNDGEADDLLKCSAAKGLILRFVELMPIGPAREMHHLFISTEEIRSRLEGRYTLLPSLRRYGHGPAVYYHVKELRTEVGFISPVSQPFCLGCNRVRLSSDGRLQDCLAFDGIFSLRDFLRDPHVSDAEIADQIVDRIQGKRRDHDGFCQDLPVATPCMYGIGG